ncbi:leucine-rich repeat protein [Vibrio alginolyticus]|uniref:leucine-rich repeat domain-containing protein n=1 Tax=Vibrio TaxID=662 RepID=UPI0009BDE336|nr:MULTISPECIES: leucine-rich repeat domain-containing protein [Vibrio]EGQ8470562.1 leucine-rich repeat protein [Vibrio alginolyticus]EGQ8986131.1 leucine-rich repeat protein [Vibrio alginolyticus]EGQ9216649.1 leucine-rich repeat protein [Vibrio alginolyticus]EGR0307361.1 leucine-rich repeat protein [Vibrio alginolyticus]EGR1574460.1 leucine-rich repeat domain-containing protein [Vibrio alginolyticus]
MAKGRLAITSLPALNVFSFNQLNSVTLPDSLSTIGAGGFNGNALPTLNNIPSDGFIFARNDDGTENKKVVVSYGGARRDIVVPDSVTTLGKGALYGNKLTNVTLPNTLTTIRELALSHNELTRVTLPDSVFTIGRRAFDGNKLTSITFPDSVTVIGEEAFTDNEITSVIIPG